MKTAELPRTYSFTEEGKEQKVDEKPKRPVMTPQISANSISETPKSGTQSMAPQTADKTQPGADRNATFSNPFFEQEKEKTDDHSEKYQTVSLDSTPKLADKVPYHSDRKPHIGSPNTRLRKRPNPLARFLPKSFSVDISTLAPDKQQKLNGSNDLISIPEGKSITLTEAKEVKKEPVVKQEPETKIEKMECKELLISADAVKDGGLKRSGCCVNDVTAGKCECVIM